jgi:hypothetical protein
VDLPIKTREQALDDALRQPGDRLGQVILEPHLALQVRGDGLDHEAHARLGHLRGRPLPEPVALRADELKRGNRS